MTSTTISNEGPIQRVSARDVSPNACLERFVAGSQPVLLTDSMAGEWVPPACSLQTFVEAYGETRFRSSVKSFALPHATSTRPLKEYVREVTDSPHWFLDLLRPPAPYIFHDVLGNDEFHFDAEHVSTSIPLEDKCPPPAFFAQLSRAYPCVAARIAIGPRNSHCGLHTHGAAVNMMVFGKKRWFLYPARIVERMLRLIFSARVASPQLFWFQHFHPLAVANEGDITDAFLQTARRLESQGLYKIPSSEPGREPLLAADLRGIEVEQHTGEVMFVPNGWGHWIVNQAFSLSVIYQLESSSQSGLGWKGNGADGEAATKLRYIRLGDKSTD